MQNRPDQQSQVLSRIPRRDFVGHAEELARALSLSEGAGGVQGIVLASEPFAGCSEFLRQVYDLAFTRRAKIVPIYHRVSSHDKSVQVAAQDFLNCALAQYIAFKRSDATLSRSALSTSELLDLAPPSDISWIERLIGSVERERSAIDQVSFVRSCLSVLRRISEAGFRPLVLSDDLHVARELDGTFAFISEMGRAVTAASSLFIFAGLRRTLPEQLRGVPELLSSSAVVKFECLNTWESRQLIDLAASRFGVEINDQTRDLIAQQFAGRPNMITHFLRAASERGIMLTSFRHCQELYLNEVLGGHIGRAFNSVFELIARDAWERRNLIDLLFEGKSIDGGRISHEALSRRLQLESQALERVINYLNAYEFVSFSANAIDVNRENLPWLDYLNTSYRLEVAGEPRALVAADSLISFLKRAPQTMARFYRKESSVGLNEALSRFNCQKLPASLFFYDRFKRAYRGADPSEISSSLEAETDIIRLPQMVHIANCSDFDASMEELCDEERCAVAHGFEAGSYSTTNDVVWLVAEIESKLEAGRGITEIWCNRLEALARSCAFPRIKLWLIAPEGFTDEAILLLNEKAALHSSRQQFQYIVARLNPEARHVGSGQVIDEFEMVIPMGEDSELIAANTVEQIARRMEFGPEAINQIKTALVEACINAAEHSLSPERKIYQQIRLENDKLVVTVSSRGVVPLPPNGQRQVEGALAVQNSETDQQKGRRGWGLKLIQSLMDEVEFETVDDGTRLRMTKLLKRS
jgi:serine/threonine-protein kinase RsbW